MTATDEMPGHLARRFQQIAVAVFLAEVERAGHDLTLDDGPWVAARTREWLAA